MCRKGNPCTVLVELLVGAVTMENSMEASQRLKTELPNDPAISLLGIYPKVTKTPSQKGICTPVFIIGLFMRAKSWK